MGSVYSGSFASACDSKEVRVYFCTPGKLIGGNSFDHSYARPGDNHVNHRTGGWAGPTDPLDVLEKIK
jgi:hypothetical protein